MNYPALKIEIAKVQYNGLSDAAIAANINGQTVAGFIAVDPAIARNALMFTTTNDWGWLSDVAGVLGANGTASATGANASGAGVVAPITVTTRQRARTLYDLLSLPLPIPMNSARAALVDSLLQALVTANVITAAGRTAVVAVPAVTLAGWSQWRTPA